MFGIGIPEFILILVVGLIVFGPSKLPEIGRAVGKGLREFKKASNAFQNILNAPDDTPARTMAATHGVNTTVNTDANTTTENKTENKIEPEAKEPEKPKDVVSVAENAHGYTPPTKESVQAEIEKNNSEKIKAISKVEKE